MKVSVAVVTYNEERYIEQAIESVFAQETPFEFEVVVGDDASSDRTPQILEGLRTRWPGRLHLILSETNAGDLGLTNTIQTISKCRGTYVALLDGDDYWTDQKKLSRQVAFLDSHPDCAISCHRVKHFFDNGRTSVRPTVPAGIYTISDLVQKNIVPKISVVYRRSCLRDVSSWLDQTISPTTKDIAYAGDWAMHVSVARHGDIGLLDDVMAVHRQHENSMSSTLGVRRLLRGRLDLIGKFAPLLPEQSGALRKAKIRARAMVAVTRFRFLPLWIWDRVRSSGKTGSR